MQYLTRVLLFFGSMALMGACAGILLHRLIPTIPVEIGGLLLPLFFGLDEFDHFVNRGTRA